MADGQKKFPMMLMVGMIVFGLLLAGGISYFIATKIVADKAVDKKSSQREPGVFVKLGDAKDGLLINIGGASSGRYLKIGLIVELRPDKKATTAAATGKMPSPEEIKLADTAVYVLRSLKIEDFDPLKQEQLKELLKNEINKSFGDDRVYDVYITNFVLQ
ncbi:MULTISPECIES: flagellar basal body-associated FliL family protein [Pelosinus]|uniref:Flagellar protein FliL n=1 Tax=Pelosinus fermentans B4 TaxID=1149862 RepID=I8RJ78_9FIRM|nr:MULTISPECIES: flagellar basal body-associated FliL family protein [Pelosinus]EIW18205.1 flagellar basal body-associated protein FliL [Pelosinus fermentans B4]EIW24009.1 flagellar basal body-associated protein FliL [Pelosinus fermentans A11]OAM94063.1 flagellar basal body-associated protein FliL [Pelosinus fermentans DSM 17108]SDQ98720.1 flagellar FliL protein [Pelosinus fermentans]